MLVLANICTTFLVKINSECVLPAFVREPPSERSATPIDRYVCGTQRWEGWIPRAGRRWAWWLRYQGEKTFGASSGPTYNPVRPWACRSGSPRFARGECRPASSVACAGPHACREDAAWMVACIGA